MENNEKFILDCTCSGRSIWFQKKHPNAIFTDIRKLPKGSDIRRKNFSIVPDAVMDYRDMSFEDESFNLVVWDPPHLKDMNEKSWFVTRYGSLKSETWQSDIKNGFLECMRVLKENGTLIMKWSSAKNKSDKRSISLKDMLKVIPETPLFGHTTGSNSQTHWVCFMKITGPNLPKVKK